MLCRKHFKLLTRTYANCCRQQRMLQDGGTYTKVSHCLWHRDPACRTTFCHFALFIECAPSAYKMCVGSDRCDWKESTPTHACICHEQKSKSPGTPFEVTLRVQSIFAISHFEWRNAYPTTRRPHHESESSRLVQHVFSFNVYISIQTTIFISVDISICRWSYLFTTMTFTWRWGTNWRRLHNCRLTRSMLGKDRGRQEKDGQAVRPGDVILALS